MAAKEIIVLDESTPELEAPQAGDTYIAKRAMHLEQNLTTDALIDGRDVAADGALATSATQPGDNISTLTNDMLASQAEAEAGVETTKTMTALRVAQAITEFETTLINDKLDATTAPIATNDDSEGYSVRSVWCDVTNDAVYVCIDATTNVAVWLNVGLSANDLATVASTGDSDDLTEGVLQLLLTVAERAQIGNIDGWRDLEMSVTSAATGGGTPTATVFGPSGNIKQTKFAVNDSVYLTTHVPHDIKPGSTMYMHVHWATDGTSLNTVKWELDYTFAKGHNQSNFGADATITLEEAAQGTAWRHMITEDAVGIPAVEIDSLILVELKRITNGGAENADGVFGLFVDFHYEAQQFATPSRTPDFYT